jgi:hypothetical protein
MDEILIYVIPGIIAFLAILGFISKKNNKNAIDIKVNEAKQKIEIINISDTIKDQQEIIVETEQKLKEVDEKYVNNPPPNVVDVDAAINNILRRNDKK